MLNSLVQSSTLPMLEQVVNFTEARHGVLAGNIANIDTPGYRTRDLSPELFQERLKQAVDSSRPAPTNTYGAQPTAGARYNVDSFDKVKDSLQDVLYHDDSDVSMETQVTEIAKNQMQHNLAVSIMSSQFQLLRAAISERPV
jgi:flagellar basal-body rod protein FlgB